MGVYNQLRRTPGVMRITAAQVTAKMPFGMLSIALMLHAEKVYGDYTSAGILLAFASVGQGIAGPLTTRLMGIWGMRKVLIGTGLVTATTMTSLALISMPLSTAGIVAFLMGLTTPPVTAAVRTLYPKLVDGRLVAPLFSLDAALQEIVWIIGPVLSVFLAATVSTESGMLAGAGFMLVGGLWFVTAKQVGQVRIPKSRRRFGAVLTRPTVIISTVIGFVFVASFTATEIAIVSIFGQGSIDAGIVLALFAGGSLVGGVTIGKREPGPWSLALRSAFVLVGTALTLVSFNMYWLSAVLFLGGVGTAPMFAALFTMVSSTIKFSETAEAYGWIQTGHLLGAAGGSAVAGIAIDAFGPTGGIAVSVAALALTVLLSAIAHFWIPDLRGRDATPIPDTEPIRVI